MFCFDQAMSWSTYVPTFTVMWLGSSISQWHQRAWFLMPSWQWLQIYSPQVRVMYSNHSNMNAGIYLQILSFCEDWGGKKSHTIMHIQMITTRC